jgi:hypothetical protein
MLAAMIAASLAFGSEALAQPDIAFEDPAAKGSLMIFESPIIPSAYHGVWADKPVNCYATSDRGVQASITSGAIGIGRVEQIEGYSDHPAIVVTLISDDGSSRRVALDVSVDGRHVKISDLDTDRISLLQKCPSPPEGHMPASSDDVQLFEQAKGARGTKDFSAFLTAIAHSVHAQRQYLAKQITVIEPEGRKVIPKKRYGPTPFELVDHSYMLADRSNRYVETAVDVLETDGGDRCVDWTAIDLDSDVRMERPSERLRFVRSRNCWLPNDQGAAHSLGGSERARFTKSHPELQRLSKPN